MPLLDGRFDVPILPRQQLERGILLRDQKSPRLAYGVPLEGEPLRAKQIQERVILVDHCLRRYPQVIYTQ